MGLRGNWSGIFCSDDLFSEAASDVGTNGGGTCEIGCGTGELWVIRS